MTDENETNAKKPSTSVATGLDDDVRAAQESIERERDRERLDALRDFAGTSAAVTRAAASAVWKPLLRLGMIAIVLISSVGGCFILTRTSHVREPGPECAVPSTFDAGEEARGDAHNIQAFLEEVKNPFFAFVWGADAEGIRRRALQCTATFAAMHEIDPHILSGNVAEQARVWLADPERARPGAEVILAALAAPNPTPQFPRSLMPLLVHFEAAVLALGRNADANRRVLDIAVAAELLDEAERDAMRAEIRRVYVDAGKLDALLDAARRRKDHGADALAWLQPEDVVGVMDWYVRVHLDDIEKKENGPLPMLNMMMGGATPADVFEVAKVVARVQPDAFAKVIDEEMNVVEIDERGLPQRKMSDTRRKAMAAYSELDAIVAITSESATRRCRRLFLGRMPMGHAPSVANEINALYQQLGCNDLRWIRESAH